jgi:hypothetical protein
MTYPLAATGPKSACRRNVQGQWLYEMATVLGPPDLMYENNCKNFGTEVIMFTK